ncbi:glycosyltransferase [Cupriavidus pinatubonensis]|uniref:UDP-N-acetylglucosamine--N-acetylmuramyl-(Pentapeptide) pyrophosphoryl-undecaprenol N-acetylglucosamine transferase n=1 Tax=Cupriavidus pinatubonensis TaxID=248026 RepID=A0ABM8XZJ8_9BURK|nr:nucleotide disphospho-sugar-binding domain-containing protein [Cupriavidus pinatubonensis]CAG9185889.1 UDP-N-acetylglucosamine--N-acetylmuramyl-(pentapeptide) pyrophosphoryl-undecaprenol N-acetylglucosamine transferase [Cupriavidus pinatubonensis]
MARYAFLTWSGAGNQPPAIGIAQALLDRGHEVAFAGYANQREYFQSRGVRFVLLEYSSAAWQELPPPNMFAVKLRTAWAAAEHLLDVPTLLANEQPDALLVDCLMFGALGALESAGVPTMVLVHSAPGALLPPGGAFELRLLDRVNHVRAEARRPPVKNLWAAWEPFPTVCTSVRELDPLAACAPPSFDYIGPVFERVALCGWQPPWPLQDPRPLVLVSFSTGPYWDQRSRIERTISALAERPYRILVTPGMADVSTIAVPSNAAIVGELPHARVLPHTALTVTHAGHGTVSASLLHGVPLVCLPNPTADQPALAAQVEALGVGCSLDGETATPEDIAAAVDEVLTDRSYASRAGALAKTIARMRGPQAAADRLEQLAQ